MEDFHGFKPLLNQQNYGKSTPLIEKDNYYMAILNSYVEIPGGTHNFIKFHGFHGINILEKSSVKRVVRKQRIVLQNYGLTVKSVDSNGDVYATDFPLIVSGNSPG